MIMSLGPFLVPIMLFVVIGLVAVLRGPIGKAFADRIAGRSTSGTEWRETEALRGEVEELRLRMTELEERLDFAERMLARAREPERLPEG